MIAIFTSILKNMNNTGFAGVVLFLIMKYFSTLNALYIMRLSVGICRRIEVTEFRSTLSICRRYMRHVDCSAEMSTRRKN